MGKRKDGGVGNKVFLLSMRSGVVYVYVYRVYMLRKSGIVFSNM